MQLATAKPRKEDARERPSQAIEVLAGVLALNQIMVEQNSQLGDRLHRLTLAAEKSARRLFWIALPIYLSAAATGLVLVLFFLGLLMRR